MSKRNEYQREWARQRRATNPEAAREASRRDYARQCERERQHPELKEARLLRVRQWGERNKERLKASAKARYDRIRVNPEGLAQMRLVRRRGQAVYRSKLKHRAKLRARWRVQRALRDGRLVRLACEVCGSLKSEAHHHDYRSPLDVRWLCKAHHEAEHVEA